MAIRTGKSVTLQQKFSTGRQAYRRNKVYSGRDIRVIAATNRNLEEMVKKKEIPKRPVLSYRLPRHKRTTVRLASIRATAADVFCP